jgi:thiol:disulfide interchange protein DsbD
MSLGFSHSVYADSSTLSSAGKDSNPFKQAKAEKPEFLPLKEAFKPTVALDDDIIKIQWVIAEDYYLYKKRFKFKSTQDTTEFGEPIYSRTGKIKQDEFFGEVEVFHNEIEISVPVTAATGDFEFVLGYQGCAEAGLCYPPAKHRVNLTPSASLIAANNAGSAAEETSQVTEVNATSTAASDKPASGAADASAELDRYDANSLATFINSSSTIVVVGLFFLLGLGLTFTPCVLPMIPILSGIIAGQQQPMTARNGFLLSTAYVFGMALTFAIAGMIVSVTGARIQIYMQSPVVLSVFSLLFVALAMAMFGFYELQLPSALRDRLTNVSAKQEGGSLFSVFLMGVISALVVSPCVSAPLAGALLAMAQAGDMIKGGLTLLALGLGMGAPLIVIGTTGANVLPRAGMWMDRVKSVFGVMLLAVGAWLIRTVLPGEMMMFIWAALLVIPGIYMGALSQPQTTWQHFFKGIGLMLVFYGLLLILGAAMGQKNPLKPIVLPAATVSNTAGHMAATGLPHHVPFERVRTVAEVDARLAAAREAGKPAVIDYYADWCIACVEMEATTFQDPTVITTMMDFELIQIDLTDNEETDALLDKYSLIGPPSILFFSRNGDYQSDATIMGGMGPQTFMDHLDRSVMPKL